MQFWHVFCFEIIKGAAPYQPRPLFDLFAFDY